MQPHYSQSSHENATPSSGTSPLASRKGVPPRGGGYRDSLLKPGSALKHSRKLSHSRKKKLQTKAPWFVVIVIQEF